MMVGREVLVGKVLCLLMPQFKYLKSIMLFC
jgi:hypothetical protein